MSAQQVQPVTPKTTPKTTPKSWPEGTHPTAEQLADWLEVCTRWEREGFAALALERAQTAAYCGRKHWGHGGASGDPS